MPPNPDPAQGKGGEAGGSGSNSNSNSGVDESLYSRQLYVMGHEAQVQQHINTAMTQRKVKVK